MAIKARIVIIGRNNSQKKYNAFRKIGKILIESGFLIDWFEPERSQALENINNAHCKFSRKLRLISNISSRLGVSRMIQKWLDRMVHARVWQGIETSTNREIDILARELNRHLRTVPEQEVYLMAHSAGGIVATKVWKNPKVKGLICLGYPFKHPERAPESYRTEHLKNIEKALLIIQGTSDPYGSNPKLFSSMLPQYTHVVMVDANHEYEEIRDHDFDSIWITMQRILSPKSL